MIFLNAQNNQSGLKGVSTSETMGWIYFPSDGGRTEGAIRLSSQNRQNLPIFHKRCFHDVFTTAV